MAQITAALVKELREKSGAGMMDCKKALNENDGDLEAAVDWLRKKGLAAAAKKAGRAAAEGLVAFKVEGTKGAVVELNAETDFVSRNDQFQDFVASLADVAYEQGGDLDKVKAANFPGQDKTVEQAVTDLIATIGENMNLRRSAGISVEKGVVSAYMHSALKPGLGKIAVLVGLESEGDAAKLDAIGKQVAMHIAATNPASISRDDLDQSMVERERSVLADQARASGKPENIIEKMLEGRMRKFYEEVCLLDQTFVIDGESKVGKALEAAGKDAGGDIKVTGFIRLALGEGVEKKEEDFAAEVAAAAGS